MVSSFVLESLPEKDWSRGHAAHLFARAGFGATPKMVAKLHAMGMAGAVQAMLNGRDDDAKFPPPEWSADPRPALAALRMEQPGGGSDLRKLKMQAGIEDRDRMRELRTWWLERMRYGTHPLREKMTLFWHGHFATSNAKVQYPHAMWRQNETLRQNALGSFRRLLVAMSQDPAMIRWLDLNRSSRQSPNENFGRELLELFTLGEGHYTEADVKAAARAFTGHRISHKDGGFEFDEKSHDDGDKKFLGHTGPFDGEDIIDIVLEQPQCARFLAGRVWEFFAYPEPDAKTLDAAAQVFRLANYQLRPLLGAIFTSREFYSDRAIRTAIKSPVQWIVQSCIELETTLPQQPILDGALSQLGQLPFAPPNVRGWEGGRSWISSSTLVLRYNLASWLTGQEELTRRRIPGLEKRTLDVEQLVPREVRRNREKIANALVARLFGTETLPRMHDRAMEVLHDERPPVSDDALCRAIKTLMSTPDFQLT